jgi:hypothetical protein
VSDLPARAPATPEIVPAAPPPPRPEAPPKRSCLGTLTAAAGVALGLLYVLNPSAGVLELLPDNLPGIGNLDEAGATALLIFGLRYLLRRGPRAP